MIDPVEPLLPKVMRLYHHWRTERDALRGVEPPPPDTDNPWRLADEEGTVILESLALAIETEIYPPLSEDAGPLPKVLSPVNTDWVRTAFADTQVRNLWFARGRVLTKEETTAVRESALVAFDRWFESVLAGTNQE